MSPKPFFQPLVDGASRTAVSGEQRVFGCTEADVRSLLGLLLEPSVGEPTTPDSPSGLALPGGLLGDGMSWVSPFSEDHEGCLPPPHPEALSTAAHGLQLGIGVYHHANSAMSTTMVVHNAAAVDEATSDPGELPSPDQDEFSIDPLFPNRKPDRKYPLFPNGRCNHFSQWHALRVKRKFLYMLCNECGLGWCIPKPEAGAKAISQWKSQLPAVIV